MTSAHVDPEGLRIWRAERFAAVADALSVLGFPEPEREGDLLGETFTWRLVGSTWQGEGKGEIEIICSISERSGLVVWQAYATAEVECEWLHKI